MFLSSAKLPLTRRQTLIAQAISTNLLPPAGMPPWTQLNAWTRHHQTHWIDKAIWRLNHRSCLRLKVVSSRPSWESWISFLPQGQLFMRSCRPSWYWRLTWSIGSSWNTDPLYALLSYSCPPVQNPNWELHIAEVTCNWLQWDCSWGTGGNFVWDWVWAFKAECSRTILLVVKPTVILLNPKTWEPQWTSWNTSMANPRDLVPSIPCLHVSLDHKRRIPILWPSEGLPLVCPPMLSSTLKDAHSLHWF